MNDLTMKVPVQEWTLDEFDRQMRGFRAKLVAYGDVFKVETVPVQAVTPSVNAQSAPIMVQPPPPMRRGLAKQVIRDVLKLQPGDFVFVPHNDPLMFQARALTAVDNYRKRMQQNVRIKTSIVRAGPNVGLQIWRVM